MSIEIFFLYIFIVRRTNIDQLLYCRWFTQAFERFIRGECPINYLWQVTTTSWKTSFKGIIWDPFWFNASMGYFIGIPLKSWTVLVFIIFVLVFLDMSKASITYQLYSWMMVSHIQYYAVFTDHGIFQIVEFISVLVTVGSEAAEKELIRLGAVQRILDLFFE